MKAAKLFLVFWTILCGFSVWAIAETDELGGTPTHWCKYNKSDAPLGTSNPQWQGWTVSASDCVSGCSSASDEYALKLTATISPYTDTLSLGDGDWTIVTRCKVPNLDEGVIWSLGQANKTTVKTFAFIAKGKDLVGISQRQYKGSVSKTEFKPLKIPAATSQYHTYAVIAHPSESRVEIAVDGVILWTSTVDFTSFDGVHFRLGASHVGTEHSTGTKYSGLQAGVGVFVSDWRVYQRALTENELAKISASSRMMVYPEKTSDLPVHAQVTGVAKWSTVKWYSDSAYTTETNPPTEKTPVYLKISGNDSILMDGEAKYYALFIQAEEGTGKSNLTFLKPSADISAKLDEAGVGISANISMLKEAPLTVGGASYRFGIGDENGETIPSYLVFEREWGTRIAVVKAPNGKAEDVISLKVGLRSSSPSFSATTPAGALPVRMSIWNKSFPTYSAPSEKIVNLTNSLGQATTLMTYITAQKTYAGKTGTNLGNERLTENYIGGANSEETLWNVDGMALAAPPNPRTWQVRLEDIPYAAYELYVYFATNQTTCKAVPFAVKGEGGNWVYFRAGDGDEAVKCADGETWDAYGYSVNDELVNGKNYLKIRVTPETLGVTSVKTLELTHGTIQDGAGGGLAAIQIRRIDAPTTVHATVTGPEPVRWSDIRWEPGAPTAETPVELELSGNAVIVMDDAAAYGSLALSTVEGVEQAEAAFLKPREIIPTLPKKAGGSMEIEVLKAAPSIAGGASYSLGIEDDARGTVKRYYAVTQLDATKIRATLARDLKRCFMILFY
ncbi:MAG: hypothetical protein ACI4RA_00100 [Kiritimatiellia bacterium]